MKARVSSVKPNNLLHSRSLLYFIFVIALGNLFYLFTLQDLTSVIVFMLVGFLTSFFSKNMMVILFIAIAITNILKYGTGIRVSEGFETDDSTDSNDNKDESTDDLDSSAKPSETENSDDKKTKKTVGSNEIKPSSDMTIDNSKNKLSESPIEPTDLEDLQKQTKELIDRVSKITPLLKKAETFIDLSLSAPAQVSASVQAKK